MSLYTELNSSQFSNVETSRLLQLRARYRELLDQPPPDSINVVIAEIHESRYTHRLQASLTEIEDVLSSREGGR